MNNSVCILLFNDKEELLIQERSNNESDYPLHWDFSAAGGIEYGESEDQAATRELKEELGLDLRLKRMNTLELNGSKLFLYNGHLNQVPNSFGAEVESVFFISLKSLKQIQDKELLHPEFKYVVNKYL